MPATPEQKAELIREAASLMGKLFVHRRDRKAVFRPDHKGVWHWTALEEPFKMGDFREHLTGEHCLGTYLLNDDSTVKFLAFDLDLAKEAKYLEIYDVDVIEKMTNEGVDWDRYGTDLGVHVGNLEAALHDVSNPAHRWARTTLLNAIRNVNRAIQTKLQLPAMTVITGGGAHVFVPFPEPMPAIDARSAGIEVVTDLPSVVKVNGQFFNYGAMSEMTIEVFPKQDSMDGKTFGNLIRLPFGWHHEAATRTYTIDPDAVAVPHWEWQKSHSMRTLRALAQASGVA
jgi:hypothetical protein